MPNSQPVPPAGPSPARAVLTAIVLSFAVAAFALGVLLPAVRLDGLFGLAGEHSVVTATSALVAAGRLLPGVVVPVLWLVLPAARIMLSSWLLVCAAGGPPVPVPAPRLAGLLRPWAAFEALLLALAAGALETGGAGAVLPQPGFYFLALSAATGLAGAFMVRRADAA